MASYYDDYTCYSEPDYYGSPNTYQEPDNYVQPPNTYYSEEPQYYEEPQPQYYEELQPQYYEDALLHCHTNLEPVDNKLGYENGPTYNVMISKLPCYEDLHPIYQDPTDWEGLGDCEAEEDRDDEGHGSNESAEYPPHCPSLDNVADNVCPSGWVNPDPNDELSDEEWEALVAEENAADNAALDAWEQELEEYFAVFNSMGPLEQDELNSKIDLLAVGEDMDDWRTFYLLFLKALNLMAAEKPSPLFSLEPWLFLHNLIALLILLLILLPLSPTSKNAPTTYILGHCCSQTFCSFPDTKSTNPTSTSTTKKTTTFPTLSYSLSMLIFWFSDQTTL